MRKGFRVLLVIISILVTFIPSLRAEYEIDKSSVQSNVSIGLAPTQLSEDLIIQWEKPTLQDSDLIGFIYKWNNSSESLSDTDFNIDNKDGMVQPQVDPPYVKKSYDEIKNDDSDKIWYLHIKTYYFDRTANKLMYSNDVVIGPINIDNVPPQGSVKIVDENGNEIDSTDNATLNLVLAAPKDTVKMYINENINRPSIGTDYSDSAVYELSDKTSGKKTIYVWFEDQAGNISTPVTATVTLNVTGAESFLRRIYEYILEREPDTEGLNYWKDQLKTISAAELVKKFFNSQEFINKNVSDEDYVKIVYRVMLGREADTEGLNYWVGRLIQGTDRDAIIDEFAHSQEFKELAQKYGIKAY